MNPPPTDHGTTVNPVTVAMRPLGYADVKRVIGWLRDVVAMRDVLPLHVTPTELDVITLVEHAEPSGPFMSWAFELSDGTPVGFGSWREDLPWRGVYHVEVVVPALAPDRAHVITQAYRLLVARVFTTVPGARKVSAKAVPGGCGGGPADVGMHPEGVLRRHALLDGTELDLHLFGASRSDWGAM